MIECAGCGKKYRIGEWPFCPHGRPGGRQGGVAHSSERVVVYRGPDGKICYPPRNDQPMPARYERWGYERLELPTLRAVEQFEKQEGVTSDVAWFDKGSGAADKTIDPPEIDSTGIEVEIA
jgi:hypothetical protein